MIRALALGLLLFPALALADAPAAKPATKAKI